MRKLLCLKFAFLFLPLFSSDNKFAIVHLHDDIISKIINYCAFPKHPEELGTVFKQLRTFKDVCGSWRKIVDQLFNFTTMEKLFVDQYCWPSNEFIQCYATVLKNLDQEQQNQVGVYQAACAQITQLATSAVDVGAKLNGYVIADLIKLGFSAPFYELLTADKVDLWCRYLDWAKQNYYDDPNAIEPVTVAFAQQYCRYLQAGGKPFDKTLFADEVMKKAQLLLEQRSQKTVFLYDTVKQVEALVNAELTNESINLFFEYVGQGGFLTKGIYRVLWKLLRDDQAMKNLRDQNSAQIEEIIDRFDFNLFLSHILSIYLTRPTNQTVSLTDELRLKSPIDFTVFLNSFYSWYVKNQSDCHMSSVRFNIFFKQFVDYFKQTDCKERSFFDCLLLTKGEISLQISLLKSCSQAFDTLDNHFSENDKAFYRKAFGKKYKFQLDSLAETQRDWVADYVTADQLCLPATFEQLRLKKKLGFVCGLCATLVFVVFCSQLDSIIFATLGLGHPFSINGTMINSIGI